MLCLLAAADGSVYAGTGPGGQILRIDPAGAVKVFCKTGASYVWGLAAVNRMALPDVDYRRVLNGFGCARYDACADW